LDRVYQYAAFFLSLGIRPGDIVAVYLHNSPEYLLAWFGLLSIGCCMAAINNNLTSDALVHCVKISGATIMLLDDDRGCQERVLSEGSRLEGELGMQILTLTEDVKAKIAALEAKRPDDSYRDRVRSDSPIALVYTRWDMFPFSPCRRGADARPVALLECPRPSPS
jgi:acyl-CoA synthetase (AMP-forming)/AMP-acid ligase II